MMTSHGATITYNIHKMQQQHHMDKARRILIHHSKSLDKIKQYKVMITADKI
jgi:hypothetical protein